MGEGNRAQGHQGDLPDGFHRTGRAPIARFAERPAKGCEASSARGGRIEGTAHKAKRIARSRTIGTAISDLVVCGSVAPYNEILGGKLVAMLAASPEVVREYKRRYVATSSVIASSMAGREIVRPANLVYVGTTSLYGTRPSQYDRIAIPAERLGGKLGEFLRYKYLGDTSGLGTTQFGYATK